MELWRIIVGGGVGAFGLLLVIVAINGYRGKLPVPPDKIMFIGSDREKQEYIRKASKLVGFKYLSFGVICGLLSGITLLGTTSMILGACVILCLLTFIMNKTK